MRRFWDSNEDDTHSTRLGSTSNQRASFQHSSMITRTSTEIRSAAQVVGRMPSLFQLESAETIMNKLDCR